MLKGKRVLITGSSRGIGAATARLARSYGAEVLLHGQTESQELKKLAAELGAPYVCFDVADAAAVQREIAALSPIDVLINNAGISISKPFLELTNQDWASVLNTNVLGTVNVSKAVIPRMLEQKSGSIVHISSIKGFPHTAGRAAFAASKAALITLTASMAKEFAPHIRVNCVAPGFTETETTKKEWTERTYAQIKETPLGRAAQPEEIAEAILFVAGEKAGYMTGETITIDGGYSVRG
ncbi:SDR family oxidoreductase [Candidatus Kaiserbacteria bacterium]|nr:SDR family oxidoreductase [Candidatus Kaiserbacteria bacterium]